MPKTRSQTNQDALQNADIAALEATDILQSRALEPAGVPIVPPAYMNIASDIAFAITSANHKIALLFTPEGDFDLINQGISALLKANATPGLLTFGIYDLDGTSIEPNGCWNGNPTSCSPTMTANNLPAPYVTWLVDSAGANAEAGAGNEAFKASDNVTTTADNCCRSNAAPTAIAPIHWGIDFGTSKIINKVLIFSDNNASADIRAYLKAGAFWGSNVENPTKHTNDDWAQMTTHHALTGEFDPGAGAANAYYFVNATGYRHIRFTATDRNGVNNYIAFGEFKFYEAETKACPGTLLHSFGTQNSTGVGAANWLRKAIDTSFQIQRRKRIAIVMAGAAGINVQASLNYRSPGIRHEFPDNCSVMTTTDGSIWTEPCKYDATVARYGYAWQLMWNVVVGSAPHNCPQVVYVRNRGNQLALPDGLISIPSAGVWLNCEGLTAETIYYLYLYRNSGVLTMEAVTDKRVIHDTEGYEVKTGAPTHRFAGAIRAVNRASTYQGPIDTLDARLLLYEEFSKNLGKLCPYTTNTVAESKNYGGNWVVCGTNIMDYKCEFLALGETVMRMYFNASWNSAIRGQLTLGLDGITCWPPANSSPSASNTGTEMGTEGQGNIEEGYHYVVPLFMSLNMNSGSSELRYFDLYSGLRAKSNMSGKLECVEQ